MTSFEYVLTKPEGLSTDAIRELNLMARHCSSCIIVCRGEEKANALRLLLMVQMNLKCGDHIAVTVEGEDEAAVASDFEAFFKANA